MKIMVINGGSSSLKYQLMDMDSKSVIAKGQCERIGIDGSRIEQKSEKGVYTKQQNMKDHNDAIKMVFEALTDSALGVIKNMEEIDAVGHRVLHGGEYFSQSVIINEDVKKAIDICSELGPLHNPANLAGILACEKMMPGVPQVAVFDTAFHQTMPKKAYMYALPYEYYRKYKIRKYGFHGTSHKYVSLRAAELMGRPMEDLKIITIHLGNGSSITAVDHGKSIDTSMGFTPLAGLPMGTRCGTIDPAIVTYLMKKENLSPDEMDTVMNKKSGVLGISEISSDFRDLDKAVEEGNAQAKLALDMFYYSVKKYIGFYACAMKGVDAIVFTAGVGEHNPYMRELLTDGLDFMGIEIDKEENRKSGELDITKEGARVRTFVIPTNEELMIAIDTQKLVEAAK